MATAFTLSNGIDSYAAHVLSLDRAVYLWIGNPGAPPEFGALCASVPPVRQASGGGPSEPCASNLLGDSSIFEDIAGRLSRRLNKLVLMSSALGRGDDESAFAAGDTAWLEQELFGLLSAPK